MKTRHVDIAIIGAGTAGLSAYREARKYTDNLVLIEGNVYGTTCARVGCMPSKLLIAAADHAHHASQNGVFGVDYQAPVIDGSEVLKRIRSERDRFVGSVVDSINDFPSEHKVKAQAKFISTRELELTSADGSVSHMSAERIVIATGSAPVIPDFLQDVGKRLLISDDLFELKNLPKSIAIFGPGVIGLELGQALSRLGVRVAVFGKSGELAFIKDPSISHYADLEFNHEFCLDLNADINNVHANGESVIVEYRHREKGMIEERFDFVLAATGRRPNIDALALENADIELDHKGIPFHSRYTGQCGSSSIYIAGDVSNDIPLLHEAADEGRIAGANAGRSLKSPDDVRAGLRRTPLSIVFTDPQIASVGQNLEEIRRNCSNCYAIGEASFEDQGRARVMNKNRGLLRVYGEQGTGLLLGAEMFGPAAEHIGHQLAWVIQMRMTVSEILNLPFYHPVLEEGVRTALRDLNHKLHRGAPSPEACLDCGPGA
ncbi:MAG: dihydrolipoyl dehydrogenase [Cellvibrio sp.]|uniref:dihydrolipoyl dehydrogenase n=1 Tax=Cellvibrio sp. TaxID=1965322 RepID=UPI0031B21A3E